MPSGRPEMAQAVVNPGRSVPGDGREGPPAYDAVVFDLDGTLVDSAPALQAIAARFLSELGAAPLDIDETRRFIGEGARRFCARALAARGIDAQGEEFEALFARFHAIYAAAPGADNPLFPGFGEALARLGAAGLALGLCTNKPEAPTRNVIDALGLTGTFGAVVSGETLAFRKPDPAPLHHAIATLGAAPSRTLYVGDSEVDAETARAAGVDFALYRHGYRKSSVEALAPDHVLDHADDLVAVVLGAAAPGGPIPDRAAPRR